MAERLMGQETEYAVTGCDRDGKRLTASQLASSLMMTARRTLPHLQNAEGDGIYIASGGRLYVDAGSHPELTTPECPNPWDVARYIKAGERTLLKLAAETLEAQPALKEVLLFRSNVDYSGSRNTWGCHESYLHRCPDIELMRREIVPHLVSRLIYTGAGGFDPLAPGITFLLSPRIVHLDREVSEQTTHARGIFNTRQEHHASEGYRRLHLVCGESLFSETAMFLKAGTTMLVVAMIENGLHPGNAVRPRSALEAMRRFAHDPGCRVKTVLTDGRLASAVEIQRHYLGCAERHLRESWMPPWAAEVCWQWGAILDRLASGAPASVATTLDWAIKYALFRDRLARHGRSLESVGRWTPILDQLAERLSQTKGISVIPTARDLLNPDNGMRSHIEELTPLVHRRGLSWDDLMHVFAAGEELFEVDVRCSQLGPGGILAALDGARVLAHHFPGVDNFEHAMANPPASGRAKLRGQCILRSAGHTGRFHCHWTYILDSEKNQMLNLSDPHASEEKWVAQPSSPDPCDLPSMMALLTRALTHFQCGSYREGYRLVNMLSTLRQQLPPQELRDCVRLKAWLESRLGQLTGSITLMALGNNGDPDLQLVGDYVAVYRYQGLRPAPEIWPWLERGNALIAGNTPDHHNSSVAFWTHQGFALKCAHRLTEAAELLQRALAPEFREAAHPYVFSRLLSELGDIKRLQGDFDSAARFLNEAAEIQTRYGYHGDLADFTFTYRAKLSRRREDTLEWLQKAGATQRQLRNRLGEARTLVLMARFATAPAGSDELKQQVEGIRADLPALRRCPLLETILDRWSEWTGNDKQPDSHGDFYWGV